MSSTSLKLDWCTYEAAKFAALNYHYAKTMPAGKNARIGVWEDGKFIGAVIFGVGVQNNLVIPYGLNRYEGCELTRIALSSHKTTVTKIISIALKMIKKQFPKIRLIVSYADANQNHYGKIYQAGNWIYSGMSHSTPLYFYKGRWRHQRSIHALGLSTINWKGLKRGQLNKFRYLMPLDEELREKLKSISKPYPNALVVQLIGRLAIQQEDGSANLTPTHNTQLNT